ncbi:hypothetical protein Pla163_32940 [Planctomycetes bacterium Pla163]|uniref:Uncharacterized protein n=1 Tax=Rohdeia mirabilis TaxID=2528008 RepID=A0A518D3U3_9BACT|nr:hypothetical protein Pla163_32940 [Planctomycetes bacterium Pla163]
MAAGVGVLIRRSGSSLIVASPNDPEQVSWNDDTLLTAQLPDHFAFGWLNDCDDCHQPTTWQQASGF